MFNPVGHKSIEGQRNRQGRVNGQAFKRFMNCGVMYVQKERRLCLTASSPRAGHASVEENTLGKYLILAHVSVAPPCGIELNLLTATRLGLKTNFRDYVTYSSFCVCS